MTVVLTGDKRTVQGFGTFLVPAGSENEPAIAVKVTHRGKTFWAVLFNKGGGFFPTLDDTWNTSVRQSKGDITIEVKKDHITVRINIPYQGQPVYYSSQVSFEPNGGVKFHPFKYTGGDPGY